MDNDENKIEKKISLAADILGIVVSLISFIAIIYSIISENKVLFVIATIVLAIIFITYIFFLKKQNSELKTNITNIQGELAEKNENLNALTERMRACKDVFKEQKYTFAGHYLIYKDAYDEFKTNLRLSECALDVEILESDDKNPIRRLQFKWRLEAVNSGSEPVRAAKFIFSGDKDNEIDPDINVTSGDISFTVEPIIVDMHVPGDDRFIRINFPSGFLLLGEQKATIEISYVFTKYEVVENFDCIWLVPDALGFSGMDSFHICFYSNDKSTYTNTRAVLESYSLKGEYNRKEEARSLYQEIDNNIWGFEVKRGKGSLLRDSGYKLILPSQKG